MTDLFAYAQTAHAKEFGGSTYDEKRDGSRLKAQLERARSIMMCHGWLTLEQISALMDGAPQASISARIRDLRKLQFGAYVIERRYRERGLWEYRMKIGEK